jgi:putative transposase
MKQDSQTIDAQEANLIPRFDVTVDDRLRHKGQIWLVDRRRGGALDFVDPRTRELLSVTDEELAGLICSGQAAILRGECDAKDEAYAAAAADLDLLSKPEVEDAGRSVEYVKAVIASKLTYRPKTSDLETLIGKVAERLADPTPPEPYLLKRWTKRAIERAHAAGRTESAITAADLVAQHGFKGNRTSRIPFEVNKIIHQEIERVYLTRERKSFDTLVSTIRTRVRRENAGRDPADQYAIPGDKAVRNAIKSLDADVVIERRYGSIAVYQAIGPVERRERPEAPLDDVELDHTPSDLFCLDGMTMAPLGRPTVAFSVDRCTGMPHGLHIGFDPPSAHTVLQCLRNGIFPKNYVKHYVEAGVWKIKHTWPVFGRPRRLSVDRAAENLGHDLKALAPDLPIKVVDAKAGRMPRLKGGIERFLGTLNRNLLQEQRGTTFSNIGERDDYDPKKNAVITFEELLELVHRWVIDVYMRRKHSGINDIPIRLWAEKIQRYKPDQVENAQQLIPLFGRVETRTLRRDGIRFRNLFYQSRELMALLKNPAFLQKAKNEHGRVELRFRYDSSNMEAIQVYLPHTHEHLRVTVEKRSQAYARGLSLWAHNAILTLAKARIDGELDIADLEDSKAQLAADMEAKVPKSFKIRGQMQIARMRQIGGVSPYGDSVRTTPEGSFEDMRQQQLDAEGEADAPFGVDADFELTERTEQPTRKRHRKDKATPQDGPLSAVKRQAKSRKIAVPRIETIADNDDDDIDFYAKDAPKP